MRKTSLFPENAEFGCAAGLVGPNIARKGHRHQEIEINFLLRGSFVYLMGGSLVRLNARRLAVFWAATPHQIITANDPGELYYFTIPFAWVSQWRLERWFIRSMLHGKLLIDHSPRPGDEALCRLWREDFRSDNPEKEKIAVLEIEARLRRLIVEHSRRPARQSSASSLTGSRHIQTMIRVMSLRYTENLSIAQIVKPTGLNIRYAMTLFRTHCGMSIGEYLTRQRLLHARRLLATGNSKILHIAYESGFGSPSRFYEAYRKYYGESPGALRT
jgi:AraC-like DNA-binding protein